MQRPYEFVWDFTPRFNQDTQEIPDLSEKEYIQAYKHGLTNLAFTRKFAQSKSNNVNKLLARIKKFIHADDYVWMMRESDNEVKKYSNSKKQKQGDTKSKPKIQDRLGPRKG